jgi:hypothetical protein
MARSAVWVATQVTPSPRPGCRSRRREFRGHLAYCSRRAVTWGSGGPAGIADWRFPILDSTTRAGFPVPGFRLRQAASAMPQSSGYGACLPAGRGKPGAWAGRILSSALPPNRDAVGMRPAGAGERGAAWPRFESLSPQRLICRGRASSRRTAPRECARPGPTPCGS